MHGRRRVTVLGDCRAPTKVPNVRHSINETRKRSVCFWP